MSLSPHKREQLTAFLGSLPNAPAVKLFAALEADRAKGSEDLPHNDILDDLRRALLERGVNLPSRPVDAKRVFFTPFEDFFIGARGERKRPGQIPRSSLEPIWRVMMREAALSEAAYAAQGLDEALKKGGDTDRQERALFIAAEAGLGRLCEAALVEQNVRARLIDTLGDEAVLEDLQELRRLLGGVSQLKELQALAPAGSAALTEEDFYRFRSLFVEAHEQSPKLAAYLLLALKGRLAHPWKSLQVYYHLAQSADARLLAARDAASALPESLLEDLEFLARALERDGAGARKDAFDAGAARLALQYFADYADGLGAQAKKIGDNVLLNRIEACRDVAAEAFERFCELALAAVRPATPVRWAGGSSHLKAARPDFETALSKRMKQDAGEAAVFIAAAPALAERLGAEAALAGDIAGEMRDKLAGYADDLVVEIRAAEGETRRAARRRLDEILKIAEPLIDVDKAGLLRDRAAAAAVAV